MFFRSGKLGVSKEIGLFAEWAGAACRDGKPFMPKLLFDVLQYVLKNGGHLSFLQEQSFRPAGA